jgi:hypothetical protein
MARASIRIRVEIEAVQDATDDLARAHQKLVRRHGAEFRLLERDIKGAWSGSSVRSRSATTSAKVI